MEQLVGSIGEALEDFEATGWARVHSENWKVRSPVPVRRGQSLTVKAVKGLELDVVPTEEKPKGEQA
jgi:membrane-bound serine protease (ClpP class)